MGYVTFFLC